MTRCEVCDKMFEIDGEKFGSWGYVTYTCDDCISLTHEDDSVLEAEYETLARYSNV